TPQRKHVFLALTVSLDGIDLCVKLHPDAKVDRQNLERKCEDHFEAEKLLRMAQGLGEGFRAGVTPELTPVGELDAEKLKQLLVKLGQPAPMALPGAPQRLLYFGRLLPREAALDPSLLEVTRTALERLVGIYRFIAWSRDNDFVSMKETLQK